MNKRLVSIDPEMYFQMNLYFNLKQNCKFTNVLLKGFDKGYENQEWTVHFVILNIWYFEWVKSKVKTWESSFYGNFISLYSVKRQVRKGSLISSNQIYFLVYFHRGHKFNLNIA